MNGSGIDCSLNEPGFESFTRLQVSSSETNFTSTELIAAATSCDTIGGRASVFILSQLTYLANDKFPDRFVGRLRDGGANRVKKLTEDGVMLLKNSGDGRVIEQLVHRRKIVQDLLGHFVGGVALFVACWSLVLGQKRIGLAFRLLDTLRGPVVRRVAGQIFLSNILVGDVLRQREQFCFRSYLELAERFMRPVALGRKNWLHIGSPQAGPKIAAILSVVESCRRLKLPVRDYLAEVLPEFGDLSVRCRPDLTPAAWVARHS